MTHYYKINELITPALAREWLKRNHPRNRKPDPKEVKRLAKVPRSKWISCASTIKFDTNDMLIDGQHRLLAIIERDEALACDVLYSAPPELVFVVDVGRGRTLGQMLRLAGYANDGPLAVLLNSTNWVLTGDTERMHMDRAEKLLGVIPDDHIVFALEWVRSAKRQGLSNARFLGGLLLAFGLIDDSYRAFASAVLSGAEPGSAAQKFREDMLRERAASGGGDERRKELLGRLMSVHAAFKAKRPLSKVYHRPELIESERTRVKEWFRARIDALDATENSEAVE